MSKKLTANSTTMYEFARILALRAKQLHYGAPPSPEYRGEFDPIKIARFEINNRLISLEIIRRIPEANNDGFVPEAFDIREMNIRDF